MRRRDLFYCLAALALAPQKVLARNFNDDERVRQFIEALRQKYYFSPAELEELFSRLSYNHKALRLVGVPGQGKPAKKVYWQEYRKQRLTGQKIAAGLEFYQRHLSLIRQVENEYGVPGAVITAIIGIETHYGLHTGQYMVAETLATLGFGHPQRGQEFLDELTEFLLYARETGADPTTLLGSYAGAMGMVQFMPSSIRKYAVDYDGNQRIDLYTAADAIPSVGNFLIGHGWRRERDDITYPARINKTQARALIELTAQNKYQAVMSLEELQQHGVQTSAPAASRYVFVDLENRYDDEYRVGNENFYALTRYNKSFKYAAVVTDLAAAIQKDIAG